MQKRLKRIFALICAFALLVTTVLGNGAMRWAQAAEPQEPTPVTLDGFENVTIRDFSKNGVQMPEKAYGNTDTNGTLDDFSLTSGESLDKKLLSMKVKFEGGGGNTRIDVAGSGAWSGFSIFSNQTGDYLHIYTNYGFANPAVGIDMAASTAGITSFINNEFLLQLSMELVDSDNDSAKDDLKVGVYVNGKLYNNASHTIANCVTSKFGGYIGLYRQDLDSVITVKSVVIKGEVKPVKLSGFENLTIKDFSNAGVTMPTGEYLGVSGGALKDYSVDGLANFDKKLLSMKVKFTGGTYKTRLDIGGNAEWTGFSLQSNADGSALTINNNYGMTTDGNLPTLSASTAGVSSFLNNEFILQVSFEYGQVTSNKADLTLGFYIDGQLYNNQKFTIKDCNMAKMGSHLAFYGEVTGEGVVLNNVNFAVKPVEVAGFANVTVEDFVDNTGSQMQGAAYNSDNSALEMFALKDYADFDQKLLSLNVKFEATGNWATRLDIAGKGGWEGISVRPNADGKTMAIGNIYGFATNASMNLSASNAGVDSFINNEFLLQLSFDFGETKSNNKVDLALGIYIDGKSCGTYTVTDCDMTHFGNYMRVYREPGSTITIGNVEIEKPKDYVELDGFTDVTIKDFVDGNGQKMPAQAYTGDASGAMNIFSLKDLNSFDKTLLSMKVKFEGGGGNARIDFAGSGEWSGLSIYSSNDGNYLHIYANYGTTSPAYSKDMSKEIAKVSSFLNTEFNLQLSFEFGDYDNDNVQDDMKLGVYINGALYNNETFTVTGCNMSKIGKYIGLYREGAASIITVGSIIEEDNSGEEEPPMPEEPKTPDESFQKITFTDFDINNGKYDYVNGDLAVQGTLQGKDNIDKTVLCGDILLEGSSSSQIIFGGKDMAWDGMRLFPNSNGTMLLAWYKGNTETSITTFHADKAGVDFIGEKYNLMWSTELIDNDNDGKKNDLKIGLWFNNVLYENEYVLLKDFQYELGNKFGVYCAASTDSVTLGSDTTLLPILPDDSLTKITFSHFGVQDGTYASAPDINVKGTYTDGDSVDGIVLCGDVQLINGNDGEIDIMLGSVTNVWEQGVRLTKYGDASDLRLIYQTASSYKEVLSITPDKAGVDFINEKFNLMWSMELVDNDNDGNKDDLKVGLWFNEALYENAYCYINDYMTNSTLGNVFATYCAAGTSIALNSDPELKGDDPTPPPAPPTEPIEPDESLEKVTFAHFNIKDGSYPYNGDIVVQSTMKGHDTLDQTLICGDILLEGSGDYQLLFGGKNGVWDGLRLVINKAEAMHLYWFDGNMNFITTYTSVVAGTEFIGEQFNLMLNTELVDNDGDGKTNDVQFGLWINGVLYENKYVIVSDKGAELGNRFGAYCSGQDATVTLNSIPELVPEPVPPKKPNENFDKITFEYFGVKDAIYKFDGTDAPTFEGKGSEGLDKKVLCGDILFKGESENHLMIGGKDNTWYGLRFITQKNGSIVLYWIDDEGMILIDIFDDTTAGATLLGEWLNLMISTEILDADGDGAKDDIELGVWFNGVLYKEEFYTILDKASGLGNRFGFDCVEEDNSIAIRSIPELVRGFDYSIYHLTKDWEKILLTGHKAEIAKGGSRDAEPFTGDLLEIGKVCLFSAAGLAAVAAGVYMMLQRKRES